MKKKRFLHGCSLGDLEDSQQSGGSEAREAVGVLRVVHLCHDFCRRSQQHLREKCLRRIFTTKRTQNGYVTLRG